MTVLPSGGGPRPKTRASAEDLRRNQAPNAVGVAAAASGTGGWGLASRLGGWEPGHERGAGAAGWSGRAAVVGVHRRLGGHPGRAARGQEAFAGEYVNNYTISGSDSAAGLDVLNKTFPQQGGYGGLIVFHAKSGTVAAQQQAVNQSVSNVAKLPDVIKAVSPFASGNTGAVSKDGTIAYASVGWDVNPNSLDGSYLDQLNTAVAPATKAGLQVAYGGGAGEIGQQTKDIKSEVIGLGCALVLLLAMFGSLVAAAIPLVSAIFSVLSGLALLGLLARLVTFPTTAPTIATLLGLGVAVDYGLFLVARHREQLDAGMGVVASARRAVGTSGSAIVVAGTTVSVSVLGLYISGVGFVGSLGLAAAIVVVVTMMAALTLVPGFIGLAGETVRGLSARVRARKAGLTAREQAAQTAAATHEQHEHSAFARWGRMVSAHPWPWAVASVAVLLVLAIPLFSITLGQPDNGTNPATDSNRQAYDLISQGFGVGVNGPLTVVVKLPDQSSSANSSLLSGMQSDIAKTADVASVTPASVNSAGTTAVFNVIPTTRPQDRPPPPWSPPCATGAAEGARDQLRHRHHRGRRRLHQPDHQPAGLADHRRGGDLVPAADHGVPVGGDRDQGRHPQHPLDRRGLRRHRRDLPVGLGQEPDRPAIHAARPGLRADAGVLHRVRAVHGL